MQNLLSKLIRWASVVRGGKDAGQFPLQQLTYFGKTVDCVMVFPYGMHANVDGNSLALMFSVGGTLDNRAALPTSMNRRTTLAPGEVTVYSPLTGSAVTFKANGDVDVVAVGKINATAGGDVNVTAGGDANVTASGNVAVTAPNIALNGNVAVTGNFSVTGTVTQAGTSIGTDHVHSGVTTGGSNTGPVV